MCMVEERQICPAACKSRLHSPYAPGGTHSGINYRQCRTVKALNDAGRTDYPPVEEHDTRVYLVEGDVPCDVCRPRKPRKRKDDGYQDEDPDDRVRRLAVARGKRSREKQGEAGVTKRRNYQRKWRQERLYGKKEEQGGGAAATKETGGKMPTSTAKKLGLTAKSHVGDSRKSAAQTLTKKADATRKKMTSLKAVPIKVAPAKANNVKKDLAKKAAEKVEIAKLKAVDKEAAKKEAAKLKAAKKETAKKPAAQKVPSKKAGPGSTLNKGFSKLSIR